MRFFCQFWVFATLFCLCVSGKPAWAQEEKSGWPFRFSSSKKSKGKTEATQSKAVPETKLGLSSGTVQIPLELKELARNGARAMAAGKWKEARELYQKMVLEAPGNPLAYANLGVAEYQLQNFSSAELNLEKSLGLNPAIAQNWTTLGLIQFERGDLALAISSLSRAIHEDPSSAQAHLYLAAVTYDYGWTTAAINELNRVVELDPNHTEAHFNLALTYISLNPPKVELARRHYERAKDLGSAVHQGIEHLMKKSLE